MGTALVSTRVANAWGRVLADAARAINVVPSLVGAPLTLFL